MDESSTADQSHRVYELIFEGASDGILLVKREDQGGFVYTEANPAACGMLGVERSELVGARPDQVFEPEMAHHLVELYREILESGEGQEITHTNQTPNGQLVTRSRLQPIAHPEGGTGILVIARNVTALADTREKLARDRQALRELYEVAGQSGLERGEQMRRLLAIGCERLGLPYGFITDIEEGVQEIRHAVGEHPDLQEGGTAPLEESYCRKTIADEEGLVAFADAGEAGFAADPAYERFGLGCYLGAKLVVQGTLVGTVCFADRASRDHTFDDSETTFVRLLARWISRELERNALTDRLAEQAQTDGLTGLADRETILARLREEQERAQRYGHDLSVLLLDLDQFKAINDEYGHWAGDEVLRRVAALLKEQTRASDSVGRYGGEEFTIVAPETGLAGAEELAERICAGLRGTPIESGQQSLSITGSIGVASVRVEEESIEASVKRADEAMYEAKRQGRDRVVVAS